MELGGENGTNKGTAKGNDDGKSSRSHHLCSQHLFNATPWESVSVKQKSKVIKGYEWKKEYAFTQKKG